MSVFFPPPSLPEPNKSSKTSTKKEEIATSTNGHTISQNTSFNSTADKVVKFIRGFLIVEIVVNTLSFIASPILLPLAKRLYKPLSESQPFIRSTADRIGTYIKNHFVDILPSSITRHLFGSQVGEIKLKEFLFEFKLSLTSLTKEDSDCLDKIFQQVIIAKNIQSAQNPEETQTKRDTDELKEARLIIKQSVDSLTPDTRSMLLNDPDNRFLGGVISPFTQSEIILMTNKKNTSKQFHVNLSGNHNLFYEKTIDDAVNKEDHESFLKLIFDFVIEAENSGGRPKKDLINFLQLSLKSLLMNHRTDSISRDDLTTLLGKPSPFNPQEIKSMLDFAFDFSSDL